MGLADDVRASIARTKAEPVEVVAGASAHLDGLDLGESIAQGLADWLEEIREVIAVFEAEGLEVDAREILSVVAQLMRVTADQLDAAAGD